MIIKLTPQGKRGMRMQALPHAESPSVKPTDSLMKNNFHD